MTYIITGQTKRMTDAINADEERKGALAAQSGGINLLITGAKCALPVSSLKNLEWLIELQGVEAHTYGEIHGRKRQKEDQDGRKLFKTTTIPASKQRVKRRVLKDAFEIDPETGEETTTPILREDTDEQGNTIMVQVKHYVVEEVEVDVPAYDIQEPDYENVPRVEAKHKAYHDAYPYDVPDGEGNTRHKIAVVFNPKDVELVL